MPHTYPEFARVSSIEQQDGKRYSLQISLVSGGTDVLVVIQKNPSKADRRISDHTINRVLNYIERNRGTCGPLKSVGRVVFLNLIPWYETRSRLLANRAKALVDPENLAVIRRFLDPGSPCIIAWGNPPAGLKAPYESLARKVLEYLRRGGNPVFRVGDLTRLGYPRHGQIWGYGEPLVKDGGNHKSAPDL